MKIPIVDLKVQYSTIKEEINEAISKVLEETCFILGPEVGLLEKEVAGYCGVRHGVGVASGTDALQIALMACGISRSDEVIVPTFTFIATAEVVSFIGATPVFADIDPHTFNIDIADVERKITPRTRCIIPVHLYGQPAAMDDLMKLAKKHNLIVIEDCAQAMGAEWKGKKVGTLGDAGCLSFFPSKNLGGFGDGGMIITDSDDIAEKARAIRVHGSSKKYFHHTLGFNSRLDTLQAAILRVKLKYLDKWNDMRRAVAARYNEALKGSSYVTPALSRDVKHVYHQYTLRTSLRDQLKDFLQEKGITTMLYYPLCLHLQEVYKNLGCKKGDLPRAEKAQDEVLSLPMYPELSSDQVRYITDALLDFSKKEACSPLR